MGGKQKRPWQHVLRVIAVCIMVAVSGAGCLTWPEKQQPEPPRVQAHPVFERSMDPLVEAPYSNAESDALKELGTAESLLEQGDAKGAMETVFRVIDRCDDCRKGVAERALVILAAILSGPESSLMTDSHAIACFLNLESECPDALLGDPSPCWLSMIHELMDARNDLRKRKAVIRAQNAKIKTLERQIEQLKAVDLELETSDTGK